MRKTWIIAAREYKAAVRTKAFVIGLLLMPIMMGGSIVVQMLVKNMRDTTDKKFVVIDRSPGAKLAPVIEQKLNLYNEITTKDTEGKQIKPRLVVEPEAAQADADQQRLALSERVRKGELVGFLDIAPNVYETPTGKQDEPARIRYHTNRPTFMDFQELVRIELSKVVRQERFEDLKSKAFTDPALKEQAEKAGFSADKLKDVLSDVKVQQVGLTKLDDTGKPVDTPDASRFGSVVIPMALLMLMFMVVLMGATPMMQSVVEEKMQRIAEVLLGSVSPFQLMMGKLIGMTGVSLTIAAVYLGGGYAAAVYHGYGEHLTPGLIVMFLLFQTLACLMFGSLFAAVGAACSDMKETQNLMWPVMLLAVLPMFLIGTVLQEPNGPVATSMSFFPFATPTLMVARQAIPPGLPWWQPVVGMLAVLATTVACVWVASRIFRVGILMQGKGANLREMARWVFRG